MKIRAKANGNILELSDEEAAAHIATGIYEPVGEVKTKSSTKVAPMTTTEMPAKPKKVK